MNIKKKTKPCNPFVQTSIEFIYPSTNVEIIGVCYNTKLNSCFLYYKKVSDPAINRHGYKTA